MDTKHSKFATKAVHSGQHPEHETGALVSPMFLTSTFVFTPEKMERYIKGDKEGIFTYGRSRNPTQNGFQEKIASLEGGEAAQATASGMAAISLAILSFVHSGDHIISCKTVYGGTYALFTKISKKCTSKSLSCLR
jgi:methionine-gamma-lyase